MVILGIAAYLATTEPLQWVTFLAIAIVVVLVSLVQWPYGALLVLMIAAAMPRWFMRIDSLNAKPEHLIALLCALLLLARIFSGKRLSTSLQRIDFLLLGFLVINVFSSIVASPQPAATLRWATLLILATLPFFLVQQLAVTERQLQCAVNLWLFAGALEALFGIACFLSYLIFGTTSGVTFFFHLDFIPGVHGSQWEPNIFGSFCACFAVMFLYYFMAGGRNNAWHLLGFLLTSIGVLLSLARQAWVCLTLIGILVVLYNLRCPRLPWRRLLPIGIGILAAIIIGTSLMKDLPERLATLP